MRPFAIIVEAEGGNITEMKIYFFYGLLRCLLWNITDVTDLYYRYYGAFLKEFVDSGERPLKKAKSPYIWGKPGKIRPIYYGYYGILRILWKFLLWSITEYYGP